MNDYYFEGKIVWASDTIKRRDLDGQLNYGQKYVLITENEEQSFAFVVWGTNACKMINQNMEKGTFAIQLRFNVFEYKGTYHTNIRCTDVTLKKKGR